MHSSPKSETVFETPRQPKAGCRPQDAEQSRLAGLAGAVHAGLRRVALTERGAVSRRRSEFSQMLSLNPNASCLAQLLRAAGRRSQSGTFLPRNHRQHDAAMERLYGKK